MYHTSESAVSSPDPHRMRRTRIPGQSADMSAFRSDANYLGGDSTVVSGSYTFTGCVQVCANTSGCLGIVLQGKPGTGEGTCNLMTSIGNYGYGGPNIDSAILLQSLGGDQSIYPPA